MRKILTFIIFISISCNLLSQTEEVIEIPKRACATIGIFQGGSLIGADFEFLLGKRVGFQIGAGWLGFSGGINYHFKPTIRSSFMSLQYIHQGVGSSFSQNVIGPSFVFRGKKWLQFSIGIGATLQKGPALPDYYTQPPVLLLYSLGVYLPY